MFDKVPRYARVFVPGDLVIVARRTDDVGIAVPIQVGGGDACRGTGIRCDRVSRLANLVPMFGAKKIGNTIPIKVRDGLNFIDVPW